MKNRLGHGVSKKGCSVVEADHSFSEGPFVQSMMASKVSASDGWRGLGSRAVFLHEAET